MSLVVIIQLGAAVVLGGETDDIEPQLVGLLLDLFGQVPSACQVGNRASLIESPIGDEQSEQGFALAGRHLDPDIESVEVVAGILRQYESLASAERRERRGSKCGEPLLEVRSP